MDYLILVIGLGGTVLANMLAMRHFIKPLELRMDQIEARMDRIDARLDRIDARFDRLESRVDQLYEKVDALRADIVSLYRERLAELTA